MRTWLLLVPLTACGVTDFDVSQPIMEQRVAGSGIPAPLAALFPLPLSLDLSAKIKETTTGPIDSITLSSLTLTITATGKSSAGDNDDWSFVDEIHVFAKGKDSSSSLPRVELAKAVNPGAVQTIVFEVDQSVDLQPYVEMGAVVEGSGSGTLPTDDVTYDGQGVFTVHPL